MIEMLSLLFTIIIQTLRFATKKKKQKSNKLINLRKIILKHLNLLVPKFCDYYINCTTINTYFVRSSPVFLILV